MLLGKDFKPNFKYFSLFSYQKIQIYINHINKIYQTCLYSCHFSKKFKLFDIMFSLFAFSSWTLYFLLWKHHVNLLQNWYMFPWRESNTFFHLLFCLVEENWIGMIMNFFRAHNSVEVPVQKNIYLPSFNQIKITLRKNPSEEVIKEDVY